MYTHVHIYTYTYIYYIHHLARGFFFELLHDAWANILKRSTYEEEDTSTHLEYTVTGFFFELLNDA